MIMMLFFVSSLCLLYFTTHGCKRQRFLQSDTIRHCNILQHILQHTATYCTIYYNILQHTATHTTTYCNILQHTATHAVTHYNILSSTRAVHGYRHQRVSALFGYWSDSCRRAGALSNTRQRTATQWSTLQHTAKYCKTLQHTTPCFHYLDTGVILAGEQVHDEFAVHSSILQYVTVCCIALHCVELCCSENTYWCVAAQ